MKRHAYVKYSCSLIASKPPEAERASVDFFLKGILDKVISRNLSIP